MILIASGFAEQKFSINFSKENTKFSLSLYYNHDIICVLMEKKSRSLKLIIKMLAFQQNFV